MRTFIHLLLVFCRGYLETKIISYLLASKKTPRSCRGVGLPIFRLSSTYLLAHAPTPRSRFLISIGCHIRTSKTGDIFHIGGNYTTGPRSSQERFSFFVPTCAQGYESLEYRSELLVYLSDLWRKLWQTRFNLL